MPVWKRGRCVFELNISVRQPGEVDLPNYKVEVKNIGSISILEKVIAFETGRQTKLLEQGKTPGQETRGVKGTDGSTISQRVKETSADYRYFPEPDVPLLEFSDEQIEAIKQTVTELPGEAKTRYTSVYKLEPDTAETLVHSKWRVDWFDELIREVGQSEVGEQEQLRTIKEAAKWFIGEVFGLKQSHKVKFAELPVTQQDIIDLVILIAEKKISGTIAKQVLEKLFTSGGSAKEIIEADNLTLVSDASELESVAQEVINENEKVVADFQKNPNAIKFLVGQVMQKTRGKASPKVAEELLSSLLNDEGE